MIGDIKPNSQVLAPVQWTDCPGSAVSLRDTGVNIPVLTQVGVTGIYLPLFDIGDILVFSHQMPHSMQELPIVEVHPHVHWFSSTNSALAVRWEITYQWVNNNTDVIAAGSITDAVNGIPIAMTVQMAEWLPVNKAGAKISSLFMGRIRRITNGGADYGGDVFMASFDIHFKQDTVGSINESTK